VNANHAFGDGLPTTPPRAQRIWIVGLGVVLFALAANAQPLTTLTLLETSDLHGHLYPWDFFSQQEADQGLALVSTIVQRERAVDPELLLLDAGDTIQGTPLVYYYHTRRPTEPNPMAVVMNALKYDAMTLGNHDFNYGQAVLEKFIRECEFPVLSANIREADGREKYTPYLLREVRGVQVGILGLTTVGLPVWERPEHIAGLRFDDAVETARTYVPRMQQAGATVIVALCHSGPHVEPAEPQAEGAWQTDYRTWIDRGYADVPHQNFILKLAEAVPEIDVILAGHTHTTIPEARVNGVLIVEPDKWGRGVSKVTLTVGAEGRVVDKRGEFLRAEGLAPDPEILNLAKPYQDAALAYVNARIGTATGRFPGGYEARWRDGPLADFINAVQLQMAREAGYPADLSLAAIFNNTGEFQPGDLTLSDVYGVYPYDNTLYVIEVTGSILRRALEHNARYWARYDPHHPPANVPQGLVAGDVRDYQWDLYTGLDYRIDISRPVGQRVVELKYQGRDVAEDQKFVLALNNYRAGGGGGYHMFQEGRILWKSMSEIRDYMAAYIAARGTIDPKDYFVPNWSLLPESVYAKD